MPRAKQRTPDLRARVLSTAVQTLEAEGVAGLTARHVAHSAQTSTAAVYELFTDKAGLVRAIFFEGFRMLRSHLDQSVGAGDPEAALRQTIGALRTFISDHRVLSQVMFGRAFADFDPGPDEVMAGASVREFVTGRVRHCVDAGALAGDATDIAHVLIGLVLGLATQESAGWLGTSPASADRRWRAGIDALIVGLRPTGSV